jgi:signal peptidase II
MSLSSNRRIAVVVAAILLLDQLAKWVVLKHLDYGQERILVPGFFKIVHIGNTGAAWSLFTGNNAILAVVALVALVVLYCTRHHFGAHTKTGQLALGLIFGGIIGNLFDRLLPSRRHVIDFLYFFVNRADGRELGFPAFNVADSAICVGVGLVFWLNWKSPAPAVNPAGPTPPN